MIVSASRRTDIPAFHSQWFFNSLDAGYVNVRNPMNSKQVRKVSLHKDDVDCFVFWTKNPVDFVKNLDLLDDYAYYFHFTLNAYGPLIERRVPGKDLLIEVFKNLSMKIGRSRIIWRYDPVLISPVFGKDFHYKNFKNLAEELSPHTEKCVMSFLDFYPKIAKNAEKFEFKKLQKEEMLEISSQLAGIAHRCGLKIEACAEALGALGIQNTKCVDDELISRITGKTTCVPKDGNQRKLCGCVRSVDIGQYNTCLHQCVYCYANRGS